MPVKHTLAGSIPAATACSETVNDRGSVNGRLPGFEPGDGGSIPSPRTFMLDLLPNDWQLLVVNSHLHNWSRGPAAKAALLQSDDRWFESTRDY